MPENEDNLEAMNIASPSAAEAASNLADAFVWSASAEGHDYWSAIYDRLMALSVTG
jgi:hypothetical protein